MSTPPCVGNILGTIKVDETKGINSNNHINGTYSGAGETSWVAVALDAGRAVQFGFSGTGSIDASNIVIKAIYNECNEAASPVATPNTNFVNFTASAYRTYYILLKGSAAGTYHFGVSGDGTPHTGVAPTPEPITDPEPTPVATPNTPATFTGDTDVTGEQDTVITRAIAATDPDGLVANDYLLIKPIHKPKNGKARINKTKEAWQYIPNDGYIGQDSFIITATDELGDETEQTIQITITAKNVTTIAGDDSDNVISGTAKDELLLGLGGDDLLHTLGDGNDTLDGGEGFDIAMLSNADDVIHIKERKQKIGSKQVALINIEGLNGLGGNDTLYGNQLIKLGEPGNHLLGGSGNDKVVGSNGDDHLWGGSGKNTLSGGLGNDTYWIEKENDIVIEKGTKNGGYDTVITKKHFQSPRQVEIIKADPEIKTRINLTANQETREMIGGPGKNRLTIPKAIKDKYHGQITMAGGKGNDVYEIQKKVPNIIEKKTKG